MAVFPLLALPPEEWLGFELSFLSGRLPLRGGDGFLWESESTAADRATVDMRRGGESFPEVCMFRYLKKALTIDKRQRFSIP